MLTFFSLLSWPQSRVSSSKRVRPNAKRRKTKSRSSRQKYTNLPGSPLEPSQTVAPVQQEKPQGSQIPERNVAVPRRSRNRELEKPPLNSSLDRNLEPPEQMFPALTNLPHSSSQPPDLQLPHLESVATNQSSVSEEPLTSVLEESPTSVSEEPLLRTAPPLPSHQLPPSTSVDPTELTKERKTNESVSQGIEKRKNQKRKRKGTGPKAIRGNIKRYSYFI